MKISKRDARMWMEFFACLPEEEGLLPRQQEIALAVLAQIEAAADARAEALRREIPGLKSLEGRTEYVGPDAKFPPGCRSCLLGTGLSAVRKTNKCNANCRFCYDYGVLDQIAPIGEGYWEIGGTKFREEDIGLLLSIHRAPTGLSYVYLEPFMEIEVYYGVIKKFHAAGIHQHMYTNGILAKEDNPVSYTHLDVYKRQAGACLNYLRAQVALVRPKVIVLLGKVACRYTLNEEIFITRDHGRWFERKGTWFIPTFHPAALLRDPAKKRDAWDDFQKIREKLREMESGGAQQD